MKGQTQRRSVQKKKNSLMIWDIESYIYKAFEATKVLIQVEPLLFASGYNFNLGIDYLEKERDRLLVETCSSEILSVVGDPNNNFRKNIYPLYKANRKPKEEALVRFKQEVCKRFDCLWLLNLEGDDTCRIVYEDDVNYPSNKVIVSIDKDFSTVPCKLYRDNNKEPIITIDKEMAEYNLMYQVLIGDTCDNYKGIKNFGEAKASDFLKTKKCWKDIEELYKSKGQDDYYINRNCAEIVGLDRYNFKTGEVKLYG